MAETYVVREKIPQTLWDRILNRQRTAARQVDKAEFERLQPAEPWQVKAYSELWELLGELFDMHQPYFGGKLGHSPELGQFWCKGCRAPWPCKTATTLMQQDCDDAPDGWTVRLEPAQPKAA